MLRAFVDPLCLPHDILLMFHTHSGKALRSYTLMQWRAAEEFLLWMQINFRKTKALTKGLSLTGRGIIQHYVISAIVFFQFRKVCPKTYELRIKIGQKGFTSLHFTHMKSFCRVRTNDKDHPSTYHWKNIWTLQYECLLFVHFQQEGWPQNSFDSINFTSNIVTWASCGQCRWFSSSVTVRGLVPCSRTPRQSSQCHDWWCWKKW